MRRAVRLLMAVAMMLGLAGSAGAAPPEPGVVTYERPLTFSSAETTYAFLVEKAQGAGSLTVETLDCCFDGDQWRVDIVPYRPASARHQASGIGDGSIHDYSGEATTRPLVAGCVQVSYHQGVDDFPAGLDLRMTYSKASGMHVTPLGKGSTC